MIKYIITLVQKRPVFFTFTSWLITLLSAAFSLYNLNQPVTLPSKELTAILVDSQKLLFTPIKNHELKFLYDNQEVQNPYITKVQIQNTGRVTVRNSDFQIPMSLAFKGVNLKQILSIDITTTNSKHLKNEVVNHSKFKDNQLTILSFMLNPGESFDITIISDGEIAKISYDYRLEGISELKFVENEIQPYRLTNNKSFSPFIVFFIISFMFILLVIVVYVFVMLTRQEAQHRNLLYKELLEILNNKKDKDC